MSSRRSRRFFSDESFWNRPIGRNPEVDPRSAHFTRLLMREENGSGFGINLSRYTIPVYEVNEDTPLRRTVLPVGANGGSKTGLPKGPSWVPVKIH